MSETAKIILEGKTYEFPIVEGSEGEKAIDISKLRAETGHITLDFGYKNTGATTSAITFLDGEKGILHYPNRVFGDPSQGYGQNNNDD